MEVYSTVMVMLETLLHTVVIQGIDWLECLHVSVKPLRDGMDHNHTVIVSYRTLTIAKDGAGQLGVWINVD